MQRTPIRLLCLAASAWALTLVACDSDSPNLPTVPPASAITQCAELVSSLRTEQEAIQSCTTDDQCGLVLTDTSCGCTRNLVARRDADTQRFYDLVDRGQQLSCELGFTSTCDCPATDGFACIQGSCTWNYL